MKPGGRLVYATCSVLPDENEAIVDAFLGAASRNSRSATRQRNLRAPASRSTPDARSSCRRRATAATDSSPRCSSARHESGDALRALAIVVLAASRAPSPIRRRRPERASPRPEASRRRSRPAIASTTDHRRDRRREARSAGPRVLASRNRRIAGALVAARKRGVSVQVIADREQAATLPQNVLAELVEGGVDVWLDCELPGRAQQGHRRRRRHARTRRRSPAATTSPSPRSGSNAENVVILRDNREVARAYRDNWLRLKAPRDAVAGCKDRLALNFRPC